MFSSSRVLIIPALIAWASLADCPAQEAPAKPKTPPQSKSIELTVSPKAAPSPAFRYRLLPIDALRTPGDAAPIYLRLWCERSPEGLKQLRENPPAWLALTQDEFPIAEARTFLNEWQGLLTQLDYAARRRTCDWNYTLAEQREHSFEILLPDAQALRQFARLLAVKARVEIAESRFDDAARTIETGLSMARHVAEGPFLINTLVGNAFADLMLARVDEWVGKPDAPNLYWALTALPRPFLDFRKALETDELMTEWHFPEIEHVSGHHSEAEWSAMFARFHARLVNLGKKGGLFDSEPELKVEEDLARFKASLLPEIKTVEKPTEETLMKYVAETMREIRDEWSKATYLNPPESVTFAVQAAKRARAEKSKPLGLLWSMPPNVEACLASQGRLNRKIAALRIVEAIRMQAAADGGTLPVSLAKVTIVPIPVDPATTEPFSYRAEGTTMVLESPLFQEGSLNYKITLRK